MTINMNDKVYVYFNVNKQLFSIKNLNGPNKGKVGGHSNSIVLKDVCFRVGEGGRQRVLREQKKNVHAGVVGTYYSDSLSTVTDLAYLRQISYNPYKFGYFYCVETQQPMYTTKLVYLFNKKIYVLE